MATQGKVYEYDILKPKEKKLVKEVEIPSGHDPDKYIVERLKAKSHDGKDDTNYFGQKKRYQARW